MLIFHRLRLPRSLRTQFLLAISGLTLLILSAGGVAVYALHEFASSAKSLAQDRLVLMQQAQDLVQQTFLIERESYLLSNTPSIDAMAASYLEIVKQLASVDYLVDQLAKGGDDIAVIDLHQASQLFRNTANIVAQLREAQLRNAQMRAVPRHAIGKEVDVAPRLSQFSDALREQSKAMAEAARLQSQRFTEDYRQAVQNLAQSSTQNQRWIGALLAGSLFLAWLISHHFLGKHVLARLQKVSQGLLQSGIEGERFVLQVNGEDEIGKMARAVEQFQADRLQLALANRELKSEKARQDELIGKLEDTQHQLLQSEKMASIGQLAAGVAHEINNPVGFVNSNLATLKRYVNDLFILINAYEDRESEMLAETRVFIADTKKQVDIVFLREDIVDIFRESTDGLQRVIRIVKDLKDFSHVDEAERQWANLELGLDSTLNVVSNELKYKVTIVKDYAAVADIECLPFQLNQVFLNLLVNAGQAIDAHGTIILRTRQDDKNVWVEIEDNGKGIPTENLDRIFDPFFTTKPIGTGTGLGLSLSYGIVKKHGGRLEVESQVGKGTLFRVVLPRAVAQQQLAQAV